MFFENIMFMLLSIGNITCYSQLFYFLNISRYFQNIKKIGKISGNDLLETLSCEYPHIFIHPLYVICFKYPDRHPNKFLIFWTLAQKCRIRFWTGRQFQKYSDKKQSETMLYN